MNHKEFQAQVEELAILRGWKVYHTWNSKHSPSGFPDEFMVRLPRQIFAELKIPPDEPTAAQDEWLDLLALVLGNEVYLWEPEEWSEIVKVLE